MEELNGLYPVAQVTALIVIAVVVCVFILSITDSWRDIFRKK